MGKRRQKIQMELAFMAEGRGETPKAATKGTELSMAERRAESPAIGDLLMEEVCRRENLLRSLRRVKQNRGNPGIDGMTVDELGDYLRDHWPNIREQLLEGSYRPQPVKRVEMPKPGGGVRKDLAAQTAGSAHGPWRISRSPAFSYALPNAYFDRLGLAKLTDRRTA